MESKNTIRENSRNLSRRQVFDILDSEDTIEVISHKYGRSKASIAKIKRGASYKTFFREYGKKPKKKASSRGQARKLAKSQIFDILSSSNSNEILSIRFGISRQAIGKIKQGKIYTDFFQEYGKKTKGEIAGILESLQKTPGRAYYFIDNKFMRISFDDLIVTIDLSSKKLISINFNQTICGQRVEYYDAIMLLTKYDILL